MVYVPLRIVGGFILFGLGITGLILPVMPGLIFLIPGLALLSRHFHWAHRMHVQLHEARQFCWRKVRESGVFERAAARSIRSGLPARAANQPITLSIHRPCELPCELKTSEL